MSVLCYLIVGLLFQIIYMADNTVRTHILSLHNIRQDFQLSKAQLILLVVKGIYIWKLPFSFTFRSMEHSAFLQGKKTTTTTTNLCLTHTFHFWQVLSETLRSIMEIINLRWCSRHARMSYMPSCLTVTDLTPVSQCYNTLHFIVILLLLTLLRMTVWSTIGDLAQRECKISNSNFKLSTKSCSLENYGKIFLMSFQHKTKLFSMLTIYIVAFANRTSSPIS